MKEGKEKGSEGQGREGKEGKETNCLTLFMKSKYSSAVITLGPQA